MLMSTSVSTLDWGCAIFQASCEGRLMALLETLPRARWTERDPFGATFLHYAVHGDNVTAFRALFLHGLQVNGRTVSRSCPAHFAARYRLPRMLKVLCAVGADLQARNEDGDTPLDCSLDFLPGTAECVRVLVANGVRLSTARQLYRDLVTHELVAFELGVLRCRTAVVALMGLKKRRRVDVNALRIVDRWMVREVCFAVWATRTHKSWQGQEGPSPDDQCAFGKRIE